MGLLVYWVFVGACFFVFVLVIMMLSWVIYFLQKHLYTILTIVCIGDNMTDKKTSMQIHESTLEVLHTLKKRQDSYEDVIRMLLQNYDESIEFQKMKK